MVFILISLVVNNNKKETKLKPLNNINNVRAMAQELDEHYLGSGIYSHNITKDENITRKYFFSSEKPPNMYWDKFEKNEWGICNIYKTIIECKTSIMAWNWNNWWKDKGRLTWTNSSFTQHWTTSTPHDPHLWTCSGIIQKHYKFQTYSTDG